MWQTPLEHLCGDGRGEGGKQMVGWWLPTLNTADFEGNVVKRKVRCDQFATQCSLMYYERFCIYAFNSAYNLGIRI